MSVSAPNNQIAEGDTRGAGSTVGSAIGIIVGGILSVTTFLNAFLVLPMITIGGGVAWLLMVARNPQQRARLGGKFIPCLIAVGLGTLFALVPVVFVGLGLLGIDPTR